MATFRDFRNKVRPNWCPGCGDFSVQAAIQRAAANVGLHPHEMAIVSGIGCSGRISGYVHTNGFHGIHGRALPLAQGLKIANRDLTVIAAGGDGDGFAIGMGHTIHAMRRNVNITYIVMDNQVYGLTKGQTSPRSDFGFKTSSTPEGSKEAALAPLELAIASGATFVAQSFSSNIKQLTELIEAGIKHEGFSFINVFSPCVTFNKVNTYEWFREHLIEVDEDSSYDPSNRLVAMTKIIESEGLITGLLYQDTTKRAYEEHIPGFKKDPLCEQSLTLTDTQFEQLLAEFK